MPKPSGPSSSSPPTRSTILLPGVVRTRNPIPLGGPGVYAASKAAQDMLARSWDRQRLRNARVAVARAGNVIGGGDRGEDRLAPDTVRAIFTGRPLRIRHPDAVRPWQHVLEPLAGYLAYARALASSDTDLPDALNFGPDPADHWPVKRMVETMYRLWPSKPKIVEDDAAGPPETKLLRLDAGLANRCLGWKPVLPIEVALDWTVAWYRDYEAGEDGAKLANSQIDAYERRMGDLQATR